jgi:hypothetical protein
LNNAEKRQRQRQRKKKWERKEGEEGVRLFLIKNNYQSNFSSKKAEEKEEAAIKMGIHNSNLWEARLNIMDLSRKHYRLEQ